MEITEVRIKLMAANNDKLRAFCSITIDNDFVIRDLKVIEGAKGPFVAMPSRKLTQRCSRCGGKNHYRAVYCNDCGFKLSGERSNEPAGRSKLHADIAHPINSRCRELIQKRILEDYTEELEKSKNPDYRPAELDVFDEDYLSDEATEAMASPGASTEALVKGSGERDSSPEPLFARGTAGGRGETVEMAEKHGEWLESAPEERESPREEEMPEEVHSSGPYRPTEGDPGDAPRSRLERGASPGFEHEHAGHESPGRRPPEGRGDSRRSDSRGDDSRRDSRRDSPGSSHRDFNSQRGFDRRGGGRPSFGEGRRDRGGSRDQGNQDPARGRDRPRGQRHRDSGFREPSQRDRGFRDPLGRDPLGRNPLSRNPLSNSELTDRGARHPESFSDPRRGEESSGTFPGEDALESRRTLNEHRLRDERPPERWASERKPAEEKVEPEDNFGAGIFS